MLAFQFAGCEYQPPAGDQTCFGYLRRDAIRDAGPRPLRVPSYGIFPPPPIVNCAARWCGFASASLT